MFKSQYSFEHRKNETTKIREKYPSRFPVVVERLKDSKLPEIDKHKFLVSNELTVGQFIYVIRKRINLKPEEAIFIFVNNTLPPTSELMCNLYRNYKDEDGFLYASFTGEQVFGN